jgi:2-polyprenyl-6-hydroxyphenyl methylase/3-demethylubiquinone-9 3-methyltransferase
MNDAVYFHSRSAPSWESNYKKKGFSVRKDILLELLPARDLAGQNWLDAGCGTGTLARFLAEVKGCSTLGVDASAEMIANCVPARNTEFRQIRDICETGLPNAAFDGVLCSSVLEYLAEPSAALIELRRLLKPNGLLLVSVPNAHPIALWPQVTMHRLTKSLGRWRQNAFLDYSKHSFSESGFRHLLRDCGFRVEAVRQYGGPFGSPILGHGTLIMFRTVKSGR